MLKTWITWKSNHRLKTLALVVSLIAAAFVTLLDNKMIICPKSSINRYWTQVSKTNNFLKYIGRRSNWCQVGFRGPSIHQDRLSVRSFLGNLDGRLLRLPARLRRVANSLLSLPPPVRLYWYLRLLFGCARRSPVVPSCLSAPAVHRNSSTDFPAPQSATTGAATVTEHWFI